MPWTWRPRNRSSIPGRSKGLSSSSKHSSGCGTHTASYLMIIAASYAGVKAAGASKWPLLSTQCPTCFHGLALTVFAFISSLMRASIITVLPVLDDRNCVHTRRIFLTWLTFPYTNCVTLRMISLSLSSDSSSLRFLLHQSHYHNCVMYCLCHHYLALAQSSC